MSDAIDDAEMVERQHLRSTWPGIDAEPHLESAMIGHVRVLEAEQALLDTALTLHDTDMLYTVAAAVTLIKALSPWTSDELIRLQGLSMSELWEREPALVERYREWLVMTDSAGLPTAAMTTQAGLAIDMAFNPNPETPT